MIRGGREREWLQSLLFSPPLSLPLYPSIFLHFSPRLLSPFLICSLSLFLFNQTEGLVCFPYSIQQTSRSRGFFPPVNMDVLLLQLGVVGGFLIASVWRFPPKWLYIFCDFSPLEKTCGRPELRVSSETVALCCLGGWGVGESRSGGGGLRGVTWGLRGVVVWGCALLTCGWNYDFWIIVVVWIRMGVWESGMNMHYAVCSLCSSTAC